MKKTLLLAMVLLFTGCLENLRVKDDPTDETPTLTHPRKVGGDVPVGEVCVNESYVETTPILSPNVTNCSAEQLELKEYFELYLNQLESLDIDNIVSMTYPRLFIPINKTIFKQYVNTLVTSTQISVDSFDTSIVEIGGVNTYPEGEFVHLRYYSSIKLTFIDPELYSDELSVRILNDVLSGKYGQENIEIEPSERRITINKEEKLLGIKEGGDSWKFIGDNEEYRRLYPRILPADILSQI